MFDIAVQILNSNKGRIMQRSYYDASALNFIETDTAHIVGVLGAKQNKLGFSVEPGQTIAWNHQITHLKRTLSGYPTAHVFFEFSIPRMGRRADVIVLLNSVIFVLEYKVGQEVFVRPDIEQTLGYALDLSHFHETSHNQTIVPVLIATKARAAPRYYLDDDQTGNVLDVRLTNDAGLAAVFAGISRHRVSEAISAAEWSSGRFKPTPTIVEAAQALYRKHSVDEITRNEAGATNLAVTSKYIDRVINDSRKAGIKSICFVTGVPGSGKTLAGLTIANNRMDAKGDNHAVFLSGNGPLVSVLREALTLDRLDQQKQDEAKLRSSRAAIEAETHAFIQNIHHYRDDNVSSDKPPVDRITVFDEAQRAWNKEQTSKFMQTKRGIVDFAMSEPELLLSIMDRHKGWATVICLVGGGQEINTGEAGIAEWLRALNEKFPKWRVYLSPHVKGAEYLGEWEGNDLTSKASVRSVPELHLAVSLRSYRAESVSQFVEAMLDSQAGLAARLSQKLLEFPIFVTRDLNQARAWLRRKRRGPERAGLLASSNALRLKPEGIFVKAGIDPCKWFLARSDDIRASTMLEDAASEFDVQGLELDWTCVAWDANLRRIENKWVGYTFSGTSWKNVRKDDDAKYLVNSYRVLLTRARQGMVIFVPKGDSNDTTRLSEMYEPIYQYLKECGVADLPTLADPAAMLEPTV